MSDLYWDLHIIIVCHFVRELKLDDTGPSAGILADKSAVYGS